MARLTFGSNPILSGFWTYGGISTAGDIAAGISAGSGSSSVVWRPAAQPTATISAGNQQ